MLPIDCQLHIYYPYQDLTDKDGFRDRLLRRVSTLLVKAKVSNVFLSNGVLDFDVAMFRGQWSSWNLLNPINKGRIQIDHANGSLQLSYWISFKRIFYLVSIAVLIMGTIAYLQGTPLSTVALFTIGGWLWLYGMNVVIFLIRFNSLLKSAISEEVRYEKMR